MNNKFVFFFFLIQFFVLTAIGQQTTNENTVYTTFYSPDSVVVSEGFIREGKPDGYWKNYYTDGIIKSEGNRLDFLLDSLWRFYGEDGQILLEIEYTQGRKNGYRTTYQGEEITREHFVNDVKEGFSFVLYPDKKVKMKIPFVNGLEEGVAKTYDETGNITQLIYYKKGYVVEREVINRLNANKKRQGRWKWFFEDEMTVQMEGTYKNGLKDGYWKEYDLDGNLLSATKYVDGEKQEKAEELVQLDVKTDYYPDGRVKILATYTKDGVPEGVRREYNTAGEVEKSFIFRKGKIVAEGIFTDAGMRQGLWKEYYTMGKLKSTGHYKNDQKQGVWKFYYLNGQLEQVGKYLVGSPDSTWKWYYQHGNLLREEHFFNGQPDGTYTEYDTQGKIITSGDYIDGKKEGFWIHETGGFREEGNYSDGLRIGLWKSFYGDGELAFEGKFVDDLLNGEHNWWWANGKIKEESHFVMGKKSGETRKYTDDGLLLISIEYRSGREVKYDGIEADIDENEN